MTTVPAIPLGREYPDRQAFQGESKYDTRADAIRPPRPQQQALQTRTTMGSSRQLAQARGVTTLIPSGNKQELGAKHEIFSVFCAVDGHAECLRDGYRLECDRDNQ